jgi:subtilisin family serine protease
MDKFRVKAYFMHEHEHDAAQKAVETSVITDAEWTDGYVMGVVDEAGIKALSKKGLVVSLVEQITSAEEAAGEPEPPPGGAGAMIAPGVFSLGSRLVRASTLQTERPLPKVTEGEKPKNKIISCDKRRTQFYVVRFHGSITAERRRELRKLKVKLLERVSRNKYTVRLKPTEAKALAEVPFVDNIRLYTEADTLRVEGAGEAGRPETAAAGGAYSPREARSGQSRPPRRTCLYNVRLHLAKDMPAVNRWLTARRSKPLWKRGDRLQVALLENSKTLTDLAKRPEVAAVEKFEAPRLLDEPARTLLGLVRDNKKIGLSGEGEIIGVADTGVDKTHPDLAKRLLGASAWGRKGVTDDPDGHGTHVAGCAVGDGTASKGEVMGAAPQAKVFVQSILDKNGTLGGLPKDLTELLQEAYDKGVRIHNNSWGAYIFSHYSNNSFDIDRFVVNNPDMLVVIAAGNQGLGIPRDANGPMNAAQGLVDWPCVAEPATAKNGLTVGASRSSRKAGGYAELTWQDVWPDRYPHPPIATERISSNDQCLAAFSSRGPSNDQRFKPDVVAPGTDIAAARSKDAPKHKFWGAYPKNKQYGFMGGTSMAAPYVAGCAALVREWYRTKGKWATPSAALLKATLINGTRRIAGTDAVAPLDGEPNYHQGFGRIDMSNTVPNPLAPKLKLAFVDNWKDATQPLLETGKFARYEVKVGDGLPLRLCLAWTDPGARALQNLLLLLVDDGKTKFAGNAKAATLLNISGGPRDPNNNVQVVRIEKPRAAKYTIVVNASSLIVSPQTFALVVTGDLQSALTPVKP